MSKRPERFHIELSVGRGINDHENPHWIHRPTGTDVHILEYTVSGRGAIRVGGALHHARPGDFVLFRPGVCQEYGMDPKLGRWDHIWFCFNPRPAWFELMKWPGPVRGVGRLAIPAGEMRKRLITRMESAMVLSHGPYRRRNELALNILEEVLLWCDTCNPQSEYAQLDDRVRMCLEYLCEHHAEAITLEKLGAVCHLSPSRLSHLFRDQMGMTPMQYLEQHRIERARSLLTLTSSPVSEIAYQVGFTNPFYFTRVFKRATGASPREFRRRMVSA